MIRSMPCYHPNHGILFRFQIKIFQNSMVFIPLTIVIFYFLHALKIWEQGCVRGQFVDINNYFIFCLCSSRKELFKPQMKKQNLKHALMVNHFHIRQKPTNATTNILTVRLVKTFYRQNWWKSFIYDTGENLLYTKLVKTFYIRNWWKSFIYETGENLLSTKLAKIFYIRNWLFGSLISVIKIILSLFVKNLCSCHT